MQQGRVSVVIPAYNPRTDWLDQAVRSVVEQVPPPLEVLIVDDGSSAPVTYDHPLVRVVRRSNGGVAAARNTGLHEARGEFVALLDQDDYWLPGKLAAQLALMRPDVALCSTFTDCVHGDDGERTPYGRTVPLGYDDMVAGNKVQACSALMRRDTALAVGGFPPIQFVDDWAMWLELVRYSQVRHVPEVLAVYRLHDDNSSRDYLAMWRGEVRTLARHRSRVAAVAAWGRTRASGASAWDEFKRRRRGRDLAWAVLLAPDLVASWPWRRLRRGTS
ncbi:glycosyltransferase family 2 protein [Ornithinimicrobium sp. W1679]|uniref:glycosyltransferase family 2 protein n=1 Tax=Ornithinimicrobium sp. W1679 TaxID=3418770 RepID=UPI003CF9F943